MKLVNILSACLLLTCSSLCSAQKLTDAVVSPEYHNWIKDSPGRTWSFFYEKYKNTYKDTLYLEKSYTFFALIPLKDSFIVKDSIRFVEVPGFPVPEKLKTRAKEVILWTDGQWVGPSKKVVIEFCYNRPGAPYDELRDAGFLAFGYGLQVKEEDRKSNEIYQMDTNFICIFGIW